MFVLKVSGSTRALAAALFLPATPTPAVSTAGGPAQPAAATATPEANSLQAAQLSEYRGVAPASLQQTARRFLRPDAAWKLVIVPEEQ